VKVLLVGVAALLAAAPSTRAPIRINGVATIRPVSLASDCVRADAADAKVVECTGTGSFAGKPRAANAVYTWHWHLFHGGDEPQTAHGDEDGILVLRLGTRGTLRLTTDGSKSAGASSGTWRYRSGTKQFAGRRGAGTYRFTTVVGGEGWRSARVVVAGTIR
jgi:hypothetical protein